MKRFVVEHFLDADDEVELNEWTRLEYLRMIRDLGENAVVFTRLSPAKAAPLRAVHPRVRCEERPIAELADEFDPGRICLLDMLAEEPLRPSDADLFDVFLFGGILGDDPPKHRTRELHILRCARRHLGPLQMTTDTAMVVAHEVVVRARPLDSLPYADNPDIQVADKEYVSMPFRYLADPASGRPRLPDGMIEHWRASADDPVW